MTRNLPLKTLVVDDHHLFRQGLISLMNTRRDLVTIEGEAETCSQAIDLAVAHQPDVVLMDILMPDGSGLDAAVTIRERVPDVAIIMLTASELDEHVYEAVRMGAAGYLLKSLDANELFDLLTAVAEDKITLTRALAARLLKHATANEEQTASDALTEREIEVLRLVVQGASNPQIAETLNITINTVKVHLRNIMEKLQVENRTQAATYAVKSGLIQPPKANE